MLSSDDAQAQDVFVQKIKVLAHGQQLWRPGDTLLVAVSGGVDSIALLSVLTRIAPIDRLKLVVAHMNHGVRPAESAQEAVYVRQLAETLRWPFAYQALTWSDDALNKNQAVYRARRYAFFHEVAQLYGADMLVTAHHADDQAETVLLRLMRGTGVAGLGGIRLISQTDQHLKVIRPFLYAHKSELVEYCDRHHLRYYQDSSNAHRDYLRNVVRLDVLPLLKQYSPHIAEQLGRLAAQANADNEWMQIETANLLTRIVQSKISSDGDIEDYHFSRDSFLSAPVALQRRLIKLLLENIGYNIAKDAPSFTLIERIRGKVLDSTRTTWMLNVGADIHISRQYEQIRLFRHDQVTHENLARGLDEAGVIVDMPDKHTARLTSKINAGELAEEVVVPTQAFNLRFTIRTDLRSADQGDPSPTPQRAWFDLDGLQWPLCVRSRKTGEKMQVQGMQGHKAVQDVFVDQKIPLALRASYPLVVDAEEEIIWIPGVRRSGVALITAKTTAVLQIEVLDGHQ
jgi:tRNA(Ile)-lysidine synthase